MNIRLNQAGDTIVEVLIALAVASLVLGSAYVSARRSGLAVRTAQERGEALKIAESQIEQIKAATTTTLPATFCFPLNGGTYTPITPCTPAIADDVQYKVTNTLVGDAYMVKVTWDALLGGQNNLQLDYVAK